MRLEKIEKTYSFVIHDVQGLDPVTVVLQDIAPRQGRLIVGCWGESWSVFWGGMSEGCDVKQFAINCSEEYITSKLLRPKASKREAVYLLKIVQAVKKAIASADFTPETLPVQNAIALSMLNYPDNKPDHGRACLCIVSKESPP